MSDETKYFDLHIQGIGYLNRIREVSPQRSDSFWATDIAAIFGSADDIQRTRFDCRVVGTEAQKVIPEMKAHVDADKKVLVAFKLGDLYTDTFQYTKGQKAGETGVSLKARLLRIDWVRVDGETVYTAPEAHGGTEKRDDEPALASDSETEGAAPSTESSQVQESDDDIADYLPDEVALSPQEADFTQKKARIKAAGYRFDGSSKTWKRPQAA